MLYNENEGGISFHRQKRRMKMEPKVRRMKRCMALLLVLAMCLSLTACGGNKEAFEPSKAAYDSINEAYVIVEQMGADICEAMRLNIYEDEELFDAGVKHLATKVSLSEDELLAGLLYVFEYAFDEDYSNTFDVSNSGMLLAILADKQFYFCLDVVMAAYIVNGKIEEAQAALDAAKEKMEELSEKYSDYKHYPNLKGFFTTTTAYFSFCQSPTGTLEQLKDTVNDYEKEARDYINDLNYVFED